MQARAIPGVNFYSLHPGVIPTNLMRYTTSMRINYNPFAKNIPQGAATSDFCALSDNAVPGEYHADCNVVMTSKHKHFRDLDMGKRLLEVSEALVREKMATPQA